MADYERILVRSCEHCPIELLFACPQNIMQISHCKKGFYVRCIHIFYIYLNYMSYHKNFIKQMENINIILTGLLEKQHWPFVLLVDTGSTQEDEP